MKGKMEKARDWYLKAIAEAPHLREAYVELAGLLYDAGEWDGVLYFSGCALKILERPKTYVCEAAAWGSLPYDLRTMAFFHTGRLKEALDSARRAYMLEPDNGRLKGNVEILEKMTDEQN